MRFIILVFLTGMLLIAVMSINCDDNVNTVRKELQKHAKACFKEMNVTKEEEQRFKIDSKFAELRMRCLSACFMKKYDVIGKDRKPNIEKISEIEFALHPRKAKQIMEVILQCLEEVKTVKDECDFANAYDDCVHKKTSEIFKYERVP